MTDKIKNWEDIIYYFMNSSHHNFIWRIDENSYWVYDLSTVRYTADRWDTLENAIEWCKKYYKELHEFKTYTELFTYLLESEKHYDIIDMYWDKNLIERESLHDEKVSDIQDSLFN